MSEELKRCPFCGSVASKRLHPTDTVACSDPDCSYAYCEVSQKIWNTRPIENDLMSRIRGLESKPQDMGGEG